MNFHLKDGIFFRTEGEQVRIVRAKNFEDPGELIVETDFSGLSSVVAGASQWQEQSGSYDFIYRFLKHGEMYCGGCGNKIIPPAQVVGFLSIINMPCCSMCYAQKFRPLFDEFLGK